MTDKEILIRIRKIGVPKLKQNLQHTIKEKYDIRGWRVKLADRLGINKHTFSSMVNSSSISDISVTQLRYIVDELDLDIEKILAENEVVKCNRGRKTTWDEETKRKFINEYSNLNNNKIDIAKKYGLTLESARTYRSQFRKGMGKEL